MVREILLTGMLVASFTGVGVDLVREGAPMAKIYLESLDPECAIPERRAFEKMPLPAQRERILSIAVRDLNYHLKKMSGAELEVVVGATAETVKPPAVVIGALANRLGAKPAAASGLEEAFRLRAKDDLLLIGGESPAAAAYGVYELLASLGCDWVMPGLNGEVIPSRATVTVADVDREQSPSFAVRCPWYSGGSDVIPRQCGEEFDQWKVRHKQQLTTEWHPLIMKGGHVWGALIKQYEKEFKERPDMLALVRQPDGEMKRQGPQVETTTPGTLDIFCEYIRDMFKKNGWPNDKTVCVGVGPADGDGFSQSPESVAASSGRTDPVSGEQDVTDLQVLLCNQLIARLEKEFPNLRLGFYLYGVHADYPMRYTPDRRVTIVIADITYSRFHGAHDPRSKTRAYYREILDHWGKVCESQGNTVFFRGYNWNLAENFLPYTKLKIWGEDIPYYKRLGVLGFYNECSKAWSLLGPSDYLEAALTWDAGLDWRQVLARYCANSFGAGAPFMEQYYLMLCERQSASGQEAGSYHAFALMYDRDFIAKASALFDQAEKAASSPPQQRRVRFARIPLEMLAQYLDFRGAYCAFDFAAARRKFEFMKSELRRYAAIDPNLVCSVSVRYLDRFYGKFTAESENYSTGEYAVVHRLPDRLKTAFDPCNSGQYLAYQSPAVNDTDYIATATYSSTWDAQGLMGYRFGSVWYRATFALPPELKGRPVGLFIGGADSSVRIWCNGRYCGMGRGFATPFQFDLTEFVNAEDVNMLAIQVQRFGNSEVGTGALIYPSFIFTGPRLAFPAPQQGKLERVLPGGGRE